MKFVKVMFLQVSVCPWGNVHGCPGGHAWLLGGMHGCSWGACMVAPGGCMAKGCMCGERGACMVKGACVVKGACMVKGGMHGEGGCAWQREGVCGERGGMHGMRYGRSLCGR